MYDFDRVINRRGTNCAKWDAPLASSDDKLIPMWVADMDFEVLPEIKQALHNRVEHGVFGYSFPWDSYYDSIINWMDRRHNFKVEKEWICPCSGVVPALKAAVQSLTKPGDQILVFKPVYYPFDSSIKDNGREIVEFPLLQSGTQYVVDFEALEKVLKDNDIKMFIFCSPHNPIGKVWSKEELEKIGELCLKYNILMVSDEIHMDFIHTDKKHIPFIEACPEMKEQTILCTAPSKTFNLAGLQISNLIIPSETLRKEITANYANGAGGHGPNVLGMTACEAAYTHGDQWVDELNAYLEENIQYMKDWFAENMPMVQVMDTEGLYLVWVDFRALGLEPKELEDFMLHKAHVWLDEGYIFGQGGEGFERFNAACPRPVLEKALNQILEAAKEEKLI